MTPWIPIGMQSFYKTRYRRIKKSSLHCLSFQHLAKGLLLSYTTLGDFGATMYDKKAFLLHVRILEMFTHALSNWILKQTCAEHSQMHSKKSGNSSSGREGVLGHSKWQSSGQSHLFIHSFTKGSKFFRTDFGIDLSSFRKDWLLRLEDPGAWERKHLFHSCGLPRKNSYSMRCRGRCSR